MTIIKFVNNNNNTVIDDNNESKQNAKQIQQNVFISNVFM